MLCGSSETPKFKSMREEAKHVDEIENLQNADFFSQCDQFCGMFEKPDQPGATPVKRTPVELASPFAETSPTPAADIKWQKKPTTLHGYKEA